MFERDNWITIPGFAVTDLKLSGNELICYSLIFGFCQDRKTEFKGSLSYVASALNITRQNAKAVMDRLITKGLLLKRDELENGVKQCYYYTNKPNAVLLNQQRGVTETATGGVIESATGGVTETATNNSNIDNSNIDINRDKRNNKENPIESLFSDEDIKPKRFIKPTIEQIRSYCKERNNGIDAQSFFDYYESVGWKVGNKPMKDWRAAVRTWERNRKPDKPQPQQTQLTIEDEFSKFGEQAEFMRQYVAKERADKQKEIDRYIKRNMDKMKQEQNDNNDE